MRSPFIVRVVRVVRVVHAHLSYRARRMITSIMLDENDVIARIMRWVTRSAKERVIRGGTTGARVSFAQGFFFAQKELSTMSHRSHVAARRLSLVTALASSIIGCSGASQSEDQKVNVSVEGAGELEGSAVNAAAAAGKRVIGYFTEWGVYGRNYHVKNIATSGTASKLTHINYAFANVTNNRCQLGDTYADYDKYYAAGDSVDGVSDTWDTGALRGNFNQLKKLKAKYPNIKVLISLGGWTWSSGFSDAALPANRAAFAQSCIDLYIKDSRWAGLFDGIDIDWEYPGACGSTCNFRPEDTQNFTALLSEFRSRLNATRSGLQLTIAAPAGQDKISKIQVGAIHPYLDFINLMTYDFHGAWETTTNFHSSLYNSASNPSKALKYSTDEAVTAWLNGGTPANKLVVGLPFYGRGWTGVTNANNGIYQSATGAAQGTYEAGIDDYKVLKNKGFQGYYHPDTKSYWIFNGSELWSYDTPTSLSTKTSYIKSRGLGGGMFWELSGDTSNGELVSAVYNGLQ